VEDGDRNKKWFHGAVWHYDFVLGVSKESLGLDGNTLLLLLVTFGADPSAEDEFAAAADEDMIVDDMEDEDEDKAAPVVPEEEEDEDERHTKLLRTLFGHNTDKVRSIMKCTDAYAELFNSFNDDWTGAALDTKYNELRASRAARAASAFHTGLNDMSNFRHKSRYVPMLYIAALQTAKHGNLWPFSTRSTEGRGARYKRYMRKAVCKRKRSVEKVYRAVRNLKTGVHSFRAQSYNSSTTLQLLRLAAAQEESAHRDGARARLGTTGRKTLCRELPKWQVAELPTIGRLMDPDALEALLETVSRRLHGDSLGLSMPGIMLGEMAGLPV
jgi:hypothetical protein